MKVTTYKADIPSADEIADRADSGEDISKFFSNNGTIKYPKQRISMDIPADMLKELDDIASELNLNRQAVIVTYLRHALNQHHMSQKHAQS